MDASWPKPLPNLWVTGGIGGLCIDSRDHVFILNRRDLTDNDLDAGHQAPVVIEFDPEGNVVNSFGDPDTTPNNPHGCTVAPENNVWVTGTGDGIVQKYTHDGSKLLLQIGKRGVVDSSDGSAKGKALNSSHAGFFMKPAGIVDRSEEWRRLRGRRRTSGGKPPHRGVRSRRAVPAANGTCTCTEGETETATPFVPVLHCVAMDNNGLVYVCDRRGHRIQVFDKMGNFQKNIPVEFEPMSKLPAGPEHVSGALGSAVWVGFSRDPGQKYMYVVNQDNEKIDILDRATGQVLSSFGRAGHQGGELTYAHFLAVDSKGNIYVTEVGTGKRIQKFKMVGGK